MKKITQKDIDRINELYHKEKAGLLSPEEKEEQAALRMAYVAAVRENLRGSLERIRILEPDGSITDVKERHDRKYAGRRH